jgi:hypothetical protein
MAAAPRTSIAKRSCPQFASVTSWMAGQGFASIVIEARPDGDGTRTVFKNAEGKLIAEQ